MVAKVVAVAQKPARCSVRQAHAHVGFNPVAPVSPLHVFPFYASAGIDVQSISMFGQPDRIGGAVMRGRHHETNEWTASIVFERPMVWQGLADAGKQEREATQLSRFMRDYEKATSSAFAEATERGDDPPDFVVTRSSSSLGVELTQLVLPERIEAWETMQSVKRGLLGVRRDRFRHLRGLCVYVAYDRGSGLPQGGSRGAKELTYALERFEPQRLDATAEAAALGLNQAPPPGVWATGFSELERLPEKLPAGTVQNVGRIA